MLRTLFAPVALLAVLLPAAVGLQAGEEQERPGGSVKENRLASARSPYLRQHRTNPVDWYPWGEEALARARRENRPILLSVGYAACHWCHVMEHESFEDEGTARLLNETFVCIKVDREERPDIDALYMRAVHLMVSRGGWPMTVLLTPEGDPFFAATYLPRDRLQDLTRRVGDAWRKDADGIRSQAALVTERIRDLAEGHDLPEFEGSDGELLEIVDNATLIEFDRERGGYGGAPKFPPHAELLFLLDRVGDDAEHEGLEQVLKTLDAMDEGGIHDHVGGGFHRYSTDGVWLLPHFEKMLYDNALLATAYARAYEVTGRERYARVARDILGWVVRELARPAGGFASSLDADTEGEEGLTYTWTVAEVKNALGDDEETAFGMRLLGLRDEGNFRDEATHRLTGRNVLHLPESLESVARRQGGSAGDGAALPALVARMEAFLRRLREVRDTRAQPGLDDKVIVAWNGLLLTAFAHAGRALGEPALLDEGRRLATYLLASCRREEGTLLRFPRDDGQDIVGFCDDHAHLAEGLLDLAEATGEARWAAAAAEVGGALLDEFDDGAGGGFWSTSQTHHETLLARQKETFDSPIPSDNGTATRVMLRLAERTGDARFRKAADRALAAWRPLLGWARAARGTVALYRALALRSALDAAAGRVAAAGDVVAYDAPARVDVFLERARVQPGARVPFALRVVLEDGWHVNAAVAVSDELVPTTLRAEAGAAVGLEDLVFPDPVKRVLGPGQAAVALLEGTFWMRGTLVLPDAATPGARPVTLLLGLQPCSGTSCRAAREIPLALPFRIDEEEEAVRHPEIFGE